MAHAMLPLLERTPVIPAVKEPETLDRALCHDGAAVFLLCGDILNIGELVDRVHRAGKQAVIHADLIAGLAPKEIAVDYLRRCGADGIISTKHSLVRHAKGCGLLTVQRFFVLDSMALFNISRQLATAEADAVEILPGVMPKVIRKIAATTDKPIIAGGLISDKEDVINALAAGAVSVSSTQRAIWFL